MILIFGIFSILFVAFCASSTQSAPNRWSRSAQAHWDQQKPELASEYLDRRLNKPNLHERLNVVQDHEVALQVLRMLPLNTYWKYCREMILCDRIQFGKWFFGILFSLQGNSPP